MQDQETHTQKHKALASQAVQKKFLDFEEEVFKIQSGGGNNMRCNQNEACK